MDKKWALLEIKRRNKARKNLKRRQNELWSGGDGTFSQRQERLKEAEKELKETSINFRKALSFIL